MDFSVIRKHQLKDGFIRTGGQVFHKNIQGSNVLLYKLKEKQKSSVGEGLFFITKACMIP
jgi:hypothetical protein